MSKINRVLFMGSKQSGLRILKEMFSLAPDALVGIVTIDDTGDIRSRYTEFKAFSQTHGLMLHTAKNSKHSEQIIEQMKPDMCFVVGWYWLIGDAALASVPFGFIGLHNSVLPRFRGGSPLVWQVIRGEREAGFSFFSLTSGMDEGPVWAQGVVNIEENDSVSSILERLENSEIEVLRRIYLEILNGGIVPAEQQHELATYCAQRYPEDGNIDWSHSARDIYNFIRAQSDPYPGAFTSFEGQIMKIWRARVFDKPYIGTPGQVARISGGEVFVICGDDRAIVLEEVEIGGKRCAASQFIKSVKSRMGS